MSYSTHWTTPCRKYLSYETSDSPNPRYRPPGHRNINIWHSRHGYASRHCWSWVYITLSYTVHETLACATSAYLGVKRKENTRHRSLYESTCHHIVTSAVHIKAAFVHRIDINSHPQTMGRINLRRYALRCTYLFPRTWIAGLIFGLLPSEWFPLPIQFRYQRVFCLELKLYHCLPTITRSDDSPRSRTCSSILLK
jgi:hypothetical protein